MMVKWLLRTMRPSFLVLTPACIFLGVSTALASMHIISIGKLLLIVLGALAAHISANMLNEYYDFKSGLDLHTQRTPFNGGSGAIPEQPQIALLVLAVALLMMIIMVTIGVYFIFESGIGILLIGLTGLALIITYTYWVNRLPVLCLVAPGLGFGVLMVLGTQLALVGESSLLGFAVALVPFFLVNNLLLVNQYPDIDADIMAGRFHYPIAFGIEKSNKVYIGFAATAYGLIVLYVLGGVLPALGLIALLPAPLCAYTAYGMKTFGAHIGEHPPYMAANVAAVVLTPILLGVAIFIAS